MKNIDFYENLYFGIGAEHYVMADFIMRGYEAVKISPDFGYDINITNKLKELKDEEELINCYLQVKSRLINPNAPNKDVKFYLLESDFERMIKDESSFLVLVLIQGEKPIDSFSEDVMQGFDGNQMFNGQYGLSKNEYTNYKIHSNIWLSSKDLKFLEENKYLGSYIMGGDNYKVLTLDFTDMYALIDGNQEKAILGDSRKYLFCITDSHFGYQHNSLFL